MRVLVRTQVPHPKLQAYLETHPLDESTLARLLVHSLVRMADASYQEHDRLAALSGSFGHFICCAHRIRAEPSKGRKRKAEQPLEHEEDTKKQK